MSEERERGRGREEEGKKTRFIGFSKYPCTRRVEPDASISLENPLPLYLSIYLSVTSVSPSPLPHPASYFRPSAPFSGFCAFPSPSPLRFSFSFFPLSFSLSLNDRLRCIRIEKSILESLSITMTRRCMEGFVDLFSR